VERFPFKTLRPAGVFRRGGRARPAGAGRQLRPSGAVAQRPSRNRQALKTCVFHCSNHLAADQLARFAPGLGDDTLKTISLPCSGKVDVPYLMKAFESGAEGVAIVTCKRNECRHFEGNLRARKRAEAVASLLGEIGTAGARLAVIECAEGGAEHVLDELRQFIERVRRLAPMPGRAPVANETENTVA